MTKESVFWSHDEGECVARLMTRQIYFTTFICDANYAVSQKEEGQMRSNSNMFYF